MAGESYDIIITGGGTAGLVLAARLSEDPSLQILVLEAGEDRTTDPLVTTPALWPTLINTAADWAFQTVPQGGLGGREIKFPQGRLLGGSSGINGHAFTPTSKANVDAWAQLGNPGWDWHNFAKALAKSYSLPSSPGIANSGPIRLNIPDEPENIWPKVWTDTLSGLGFPVSGDIFSGQYYGGVINPESVDPATKQRSYSAKAYLEPARARSNLTVLTQATVEKILFDRSRPDGALAEGVQYTKDGETKTVKARKEVILTAGVFNSPRLLELSGIGGASLLQKLGINVVIDNPYVGENLQNHLMCGVSFEVLDGLKTMDPLARQDPSALGAAMEAYGKGCGPFSNSGTYASAQLPFPGIQTPEGKQELDQLLANIEGPKIDASTTSVFAEAHESLVRSILASPTEASGVYISFPGYASFNPDGSMAPPPAGTENYFSIALLLAHPLSRGSVHATSANGDLAIDPCYLSHPLDLEVMARHLRFLELSLAGARPLASQLKANGKRNVTAPAPGSFADLDAAREYLRRTAVGAHHFTGTCAMMPREIGGVVDEQLRVYGCRNLRVCDASIIPLTPRANPQATVYGVAERAAELIKQSLYQN